MSKSRYGVLLVIAIALLLPVRSSADVSVGATIDENGVKEFHLAIGKFYNVPERALVTLQKKGVKDEELAVVLFIAERAAIKPAPIIELRELGKSWLEITAHFGLSPEIYYVPVNGDPGPPYGKAYGYFKKHPRGEWRNIQLSDAEIVNLVNLRFVSKHYGIAPEDVIQMRADGHPFAKVCLKAKDIKDKQKAQARADRGRRNKAHADAEQDNQGKNGEKGNAKKSK